MKCLNADCNKEAYRKYCSKSCATKANWKNPKCREAYIKNIKSSIDKGTCGTSKLWKSDEFKTVLTEGHLFSRTLNG